MKTCYTCNESKPAEAYSLRSDGKGPEGVCKVCKNIYAKAKQREKRLADPVLSKRKQMLANARHRAKTNGYPCTITLDDICQPDTCPVLGIPLDWNSSVRANPNGPSLDKHVPELGYIPGNVSVVSRRGNMLKSDMTVEDAENVLRFLKSLGLEK